MTNPKTILIVDDEPDLIDIAQTYLEEAGYKVVSAADGLKGLELAKTLKPNLILLDIAMPGIDGLEMLNILRGTPGLAGIPVIMLTARGRTDNIFESERLRAIDFLIKPFVPEELLSIVRKVM